MLDLPDKFKLALGSGVRTSLFPVVVIGSSPEVILSIKATTIGGKACDPLLLSSPSIKSSADIINNKYTISSVSLSVSNAPYHGKIFSDIVHSLLNQKTEIYYCANGLNELDDCLLVYTGTLRRYSQSAETIKLSLEDLTEDKLTTKIPSTLIEDDTKYKQEDLGKPYPMIYGFVENAPLIFSNNNLEIDKPNLDIGGVWQPDRSIDYKNDYITSSHPLIQQSWLSTTYYLSIYEDGWIPLGIDVPINFGSRDHAITGKTIYSFNDGDSYNSSNIALDPNVFLHENYSNDGDGIGAYGVPTRIYRPITKVGCYVHNNWDEEPKTENKFYGYGNDSNGDLNFLDEIVTGNQGSGLANDDSKIKHIYGSFLDDGNLSDWWAPSIINFGYSQFKDEYVEYTDIGREAQNLNDEFPVDWIQNNDVTSGLHLTAQNSCAPENDLPVDVYAGGGYARLHLDQTAGSFPCITKILYNINYNSPANQSIMPTNNAVFAEPPEFWIEKRLKLKKQLYTGVWTQTLYDDMENEGRTYWRFEYDNGTEHTFCMTPNHEHEWDLLGTGAELYRYFTDDDGTQWKYYVYVNKDDSIFNFINGSSDYDNYIGDFNTTDAYDSIQWGMPSLFAYFGGNQDYTSIMSSCIANLREVYVTQDCLITELENKQFYANIKGRESGGELITRATDMLENILTEELGYTGNIVRDDSGLEDEWLHSFALDEQKEAKSIFQDLFKSTITIPSFNSSGEFRFIPIHQKLSSSDINGFTTINVNDILKYSFELSKLEDVYNQVNVKYKKNYGSGEFDAFTGYGVETNSGTVRDDLDAVTRDIYPSTPAKQYDISYYGKTDGDSKLEVESEYIRDELTARRLQRRLLMWHCNQHLIVKLDIPPSYMHFEAGDYIKFEELIGGKKAFGYEYHQGSSSDVGFNKNGQMVYPAFFITKVSKSLTKVSIEAIQVHRGEVGMNDSDASSYILDNPYDLDIYAGDDVALAEEKFSIKWAQFKNNISMGSINAILDTEVEGSFDYTIWITSISADFSFAGQEFLAGDYEVGQISALNLVGHSKSENRNGMGGLVKISKLAEIQNPLLELTFNLEITLDDYVANNEFFQSYVPAIKHDLGDINQDGIINVLDVVAFVVAIQNDQEDTLPPQADINGDGIYNVQDIVMILDYILTGGWDEEIIIDDGEDDDEDDDGTGGGE